MSDVMLFQGPDGGDVNVTAGVLALDDTPFTAVYLSLFGGNVEDNGTTSTESKQWWANVAEEVADRRYRSQTQAALIGLPAIPANTVRLEQAAASDLEWMQTEGVASEVAISVTMPARNTARVFIKITGADGSVYPFEFTKPWGQARN